MGTIPCSVYAGDVSLVVSGSRSSRAAISDFLGCFSGRYFILSMFECHVRFERIFDTISEHVKTAKSVDIAVPELAVTMEALSKHLDQKMTNQSANFVKSLIDYGRAHDFIHTPTEANSLFFNPAAPECRPATTNPSSSNAEATELDVRTFRDPPTELTLDEDDSESANGHPGTYSLAKPRQLQSTQTRPESPTSSRSNSLNRIFKDYRGETLSSDTLGTFAFNHDNKCIACGDAVNKELFIQHYKDTHQQIIKKFILSFL